LKDSKQDSSTYLGTQQGYTPPTSIQHPKKRAFLAAYADVGTITHAAQAAGIYRGTVYEWCESDPVFADAWEEAKEAFADLLEREARRRAVDGVEEYVLHHGKVLRDPETGAYLKRRTYSDRLMELMLRAKRPAEYRDRTSTELSGPDGAPLSVHSRVAGMSEDDLDNLLAELDESGKETGAE
jgi:hypothetical protein